MSRARSYILLIALVAACLASLLLAFFVGSSGFSWPEFVSLLEGNASNAVRNVFLQLRLPRALGALLVGASLSVSGCGLQGVFRNPMADPYVLGISAGAGLGAALGLTFMHSVVAAALCSFVFGLGTIFVVYQIAHVSGKVSTFSLLLSGFVVSSLMSALLSLIMILHRDKMEQVVMWNMGSLSAMSWPRVWILAPVCVIGIAALMMQARSLNVMLTGEESAQSMGIDTHTTVRRILVLTSLLSATAVSVSGVIGFVGLMIPHLLRLACGPDNRTLLPLCAFGGGAYLVLCDIAARTVVPGREIPVGVITAILGVPFFIFLLRKSKGGAAT